jgi:hypothetical protein
VPESAPRPRRGLESVRDIVLSMALVGLAVVAIYLVVVWQRPEVQGPIRQDPDVAQLVGEVKGSGALPALRPRSLADSWEPTSAWFQTADVSDVGGAVLHVGYLTPAGSYAEVNQTDGELTAALNEWMDADPQAVGSVTIAGQRWQQFETSDQTALVLRQPKSLKVVVTGKAQLAELEQLADSLR